MLAALRLEYLKVVFIEEKTFVDRTFVDAVVDGFFYSNEAMKG